MSYSLELKNLSKRFPKSSFCLDDVSFSLPKGSIMGFIGENGAGKTTTISCILNTIKKDSGVVRVLGNEMSDDNAFVKEDIGVVFDTSSFSGDLTAKNLSKIMRGIYSRWDDSVFQKHLSIFELSLNQRIKTFSKGMSMKLAIAVALAHSPKLLILDEATSGLDPVVRDDILDIFLEFVQKEENSILLSSHVTSDLEKIADYITFIHNGRIVLSAKKDDLIYKYAIARCNSSQFSALENEDIVAYRKKGCQTDVLVSNKHEIGRKYKDLVIDAVTIDEIMLLMIKGENA